MSQPVLYNQPPDLLRQQLQGCCLRQCLLKQNIQIPMNKIQQTQKKQRKRRLSLYSISSIHQDTKQNDDNTDSQFRRFSITKNNRSPKKLSQRTNQQVFKARRISLTSNRYQQKQNIDIKQSNRKGLRVSMANKSIKISAIQEKGNTTPFRVNISRPSSTLENYDDDEHLNIFYKNSQRSIKQTFIVRTPSQSQVSQNSKRASTPSKRPNLIRQQNYISFNQIPNPTSGRINEFNIIPEPARLTFYKSQFQRQKRSQINRISDISDIDMIKKDSILIEPHGENSVVGVLFAHKFNQNTLKQFSKTKRPQLKIRMLQQYFIRGGYRGSGRISSVYIVQLKQFGFLFASKQVFKKTIYEKDFTSQVQRQIALHYSLQTHENVITLYQVFEDYQRFYFIQQLSDSNLRTKMTTYINESKAVKYIKDILNGLVFLHSKGIIHRHLKPQNILMFQETCKLSDFGWAPKLLYMNNFEQLPEYCSPQILNKQPYNQKTDLWSVGVIAYELITSHQPFNIFTQNYELDLSQLRISSPFRKLIYRLLQVNEDKRATIHEALKLIQQCK